MNNTSLFSYSTNILVRLLAVNMKNGLTPKIRKFHGRIQNMYLEFMDHPMDLVHRPFREPVHGLALWTTPNF